MHDESNTSKGTSRSTPKSKAKSKSNENQTLPKSEKKSESKKEAQDPRAPPKTGLVYLPGVEEHRILTDDNEYYERCERVTLAYERLKETGVLEYLQVSDTINARKSTKHEMLTCHDENYITAMESSKNMSKEELVDLMEKFECVSLCESSFDYAKTVAAQLIDCCNKVAMGSLRNAFALVRPPSHHSEQQMGASGYCILNTVAIAVMNLIDNRKNGVGKVLIFDWDVHHGQGTQQIFYERDDVLYISMHSFQRATFFPYLPESDIFHIGTDKGKGFNVNIAWDETGLGDEEYMAAFLQIVLPLAYSFEPDFVVILAGFDSADGGDPEGDMKVSPACYAHMTHHLKAVANGNMLVTLEGGYNPPVVANCVEAVVKVLLGLPPPNLQLTGDINSSAVQTILDVIGVIGDYWTCFQFQEEQSEEAISHTDPCSIEGYRLSVKEELPSYKFSKSKFSCDLKDELADDRKIGYCFDAKMLRHKYEEDPSHPEKPERIASINTRLSTSRLLDRCLLIRGENCEFETLNLVHNEDYLKAFEELHCVDEYSKESEKLYLQNHCLGSIYHNKYSYGSAQVSAGSLVRLTSMIVTDSGTISAGFANIRPPGHHAEVNKEYGFCFYNNAAVAAQHILTNYNSKVQRVLILDWDVHHGNGTQHQFENNPNVLYISLHRHGWFFPGGYDGNSDRVGTGKGEGFNVNVPWLVGEATDVEYIAAFTNLILPILYEFNPHLVLVSSGFDSAYGDPLGGQLVSAECYAHMTHMLMAFASGRVILALEGGYNLQSIADCSEQCVRTLLREPCPKLPTKLRNASLKPYHRTGILETIWHHRKYWKQLRFLKSVDESVTKPLQTEDDEVEVPSIDKRSVPPKDTRESMLFWREYWTEECKK